MSSTEVMAEIETLEHFRMLDCGSCSAQIRVHCLEIHADCPACGQEHKCRAFGGIGTEIQDVIDAVLKWAGEGETLEAVMRRHASIMSADV